MTVGEPPDDLSADARAVWDERLSVWGHLLTAGDRDLLRLYCEIWVDRQRARELSAESTMVRSASGETVLNPWTRRADDCHARLVRILAELGVTPGSRGKAPPRLPVGSAGRRRNERTVHWVRIESFALR